MKPTKNIQLLNILQKSSGNKQTRRQPFFSFGSFMQNILKSKPGNAAKAKFHLIRFGNPRSQAVTITKREMVPIKTEPKPTKIKIQSFEEFAHLLMGHISPESNGKQTESTGIKETIIQGLFLMQQDKIPVKQWKQLNEMFPGISLESKEKAGKKLLTITVTESKLASKVRTVLSKIETKAGQHHVYIPKIKVVNRSNVKTETVKTAPPVEKTQKALKTKNEVSVQQPKKSAAVSVKAAPIPQTKMKTTAGLPKIAGTDKITGTEEPSKSGQTRTVLTETVASVSGKAASKSKTVKSGSIRSNSAASSIEKTPGLVKEAPVKTKVEKPTTLKTRPVKTEVKTQHTEKRNPRKSVSDHTEANKPQRIPMQNDNSNRLKARAAINKQPEAIHAKTDHTEANKPQRIPMQNDNSNRLKAKAAINKQPDTIHAEPESRGGKQDTEVKNSSVKLTTARIPKTDAKPLASQPHAAKSNVESLTQTRHIRQQVNEGTIKVSHKQINRTAQPEIITTSSRVKVKTSDTIPKQDAAQSDIPKATEAAKHTVPKVRAAEAVNQAEPEPVKPQQKQQTTSSIQVSEAPALHTKQTADLPKMQPMVTRLQELIEKFDAVRKTAKSKTTFRIENSPAGNLEIQFKEKNGQKQIKVIVESEATRHELQKAAPQLQQNLNAKGLEIVTFSVQLGSLGGKTGPTAQHHKSNNRHKTKQTKEVPHEAEQSTVTQRQFGYNTIEVIA